MPRGGRRRGRPGQQYPNRSDLGNPAAQAPTANPAARAAAVTRPPRVRIEGAQGLQATPQAARAPEAPPAPPSPAFPLPGSFGPLSRPTERPDEPLTAGLPFGPGPGPEALAVPPQTTADELRAIYARYPLPELRELIEDIEEEERGP